MTTDDRNAQLSCYFPAAPGNPTTGSTRLWLETFTYVNDAASQFPSATVWMVPGTCPDDPHSAKASHCAKHIVPLVHDWNGGTW